MTLAELLPVVEDLSATDKQTLLHVLAEELNVEKTASSSPLAPDNVYYVATPYEMYGAGDALMELLKSPQQ